MWHKASSELPEGNKWHAIKYVDKTNSVIATGTGMYDSVLGRWSIRYDSILSTELSTSLKDSTLLWESALLDSNVNSDHLNQSAVETTMYGMLDAIYKIISDKGIGLNKLSFVKGMKLWKQMRSECNMKCSKYIDNEGKMTICPFCCMCSYSAEGIMSITVSDILNMDYLLEQYNRRLEYEAEEAE